MVTQSELRSIFDVDRKRAGGVASPERFPVELRSTITNVLEENRRILESSANTLPPTYVCFNIYTDIIDNPTLNAVAFESDGHEFIGVNVGTLIFLYDSFLCLFSHPKFMPEIGDASAEHASDSEIREYLQRLDITHVHEYCPIDPARARAAGYLTINAYNFLLAHEVGHLTKGHISYLKQICGLSEHFAYENANAPSLEIPTRHALEIGADESAAHATLHIWKPSAPAGSFPDTGGLCRDFRVWAISVGVIFALFDRHVELYNSLAVSSHPKTDVRFLNVLLSAWEETQHIVPDAIAACHGQTLMAASELNDFLSEIGFPHCPFQFIDTTNGEPNNAFIADLIEKTVAIRERLIAIENEQMQQLAIDRSIALRKARGLPIVGA